MINEIIIVTFILHYIPYNNLVEIGFCYVYSITAMTKQNNSENCKRVRKYFTLLIV